MKIIALKGGVNSGKSHTINIVYHFLLRDGYTQLPGHFRILGNPKFEDVIDILIKKGIKIGLIGMGDYQKGIDSLASLIMELEIKGCDVVICSCRNIPKIEMAVTNYPNHFFVDKTPSSGDDNNRIVNVFDAERVVTLI
ncbi:MAG: hypothetical protein Q7W13_16400 [Bacteroidia bacterium]|nr:hypothetical protein [Bacteroidia bacterium]